MNDILQPESASQAMKSRKNESVDVLAGNSSKDLAAPAGFEQTFFEHWPRIYRLLLRLVGDPSEAEDLALETFMRLYQRPPASEDVLNLGGWLYRVATNLGLHSIRSFKRRERYELAAGKGALEAAAGAHPADSLSEAEERRIARLVLGQMNDRQAQLLVMRYSGMAYKEIASALGVSPTSIGPLLLRAEREFAKRYRALNREEG